MKLALQKGSFSDSPTGSSIVCFIHGCPQKCPYCFNHNLSASAKISVPDAIKEIRALRSINTNTGEPFHTYDWVIVSGGECMANAELVQQILQETRRVSNGDDIPIKTGVYTNGSYYEELKELVTAGLLDYVHLDVKLKIEDLEKYGFNETARLSFAKSIDFLVKQYSQRKLDYLKLGTVLTKQDHNIDYIIDMITSISSSFAVQPTYAFRDDPTKDKFVWEFVDFWDDNGKIQCLNPSYTLETSKWSDSDKKSLGRTLKIVNAFKCRVTDKPKKELVLHPAHYNSGKYEVIDILKDQLTLDEYKGFLRGNVLKYVMRAPYKEDETQDYKKAEFYLKALLKQRQEED
jgi:pyruvate-formate lyase-activating enzyme